MSDAHPGSLSSLSDMRVRITTQIEPLLKRSAELGFLGRMPIAEQIDHSLGFVAAAEWALGRRPTAVVDLGSGGGVPGIILVVCWPAARLVLMDANERRTDFLSEVMTGAGLSGQVEVVRARAEEMGRSGEFRTTFDLVTSRSFGAPAVTAECGAGLLTFGGAMVVSEPPEGEDRWSPDGLLPLGLVPSGRLRFADRFGYEVLRKEGPTADRYPRRTGIPSKRPLF